MRRNSTELRKKTLGLPIVILRSRTRLYRSSVAAVLKMTTAKGDNVKTSLECSPTRAEKSITSAKPYCIQLGRRASAFLTVPIALLFLQAAGSAQDFAPSNDVILRPLSELDARVWKDLSRTQIQTQSNTAASQSTDSLDPTTYSLFTMLGTDGGRRLNNVNLMINTSAQTVKVLVEYFDLKGQPLSLPFQNQSGGFAGLYSSASGEVPPGAVASPSLLQRNEPARYGWARITYDVPNALAVSNFAGSQDSSRFGAFVHKSSDPTYSPVEIPIENTPATKSTWLGIVNPDEDPLDLNLNARKADGSPACKVSIRLQPGEMLWKTAQSLIPCQRSGTANYILNIEPVNGEAIVQAYYEYGALIYAAAPVYDIALDDPNTEQSASQSFPQAKTAPCRPTFSPLNPRLTSEQTTIPVTMDFSGCNPDQSWTFKSGTSWVSLVDKDERAVGAMTGSGSATFNVRIDAAAARKYSGVRTGTLYLTYKDPKIGNTTVLYQVRQPIPKL